MKLPEQSTLARLLIVITAAAILAGFLLISAMIATPDPDPGAPAAGTWRQKIEEPTTSGGGWRTAREPRTGMEQGAELSRLASLGYLPGGASAPSSSGVALNDVTRTCKGLNLCVSGDLPGARLLDMEGNVVHEWHYPFNEAWPSRRKEYETAPGAKYWFNAHVFDNGDVIGIFNGLGLVKLDRDSNLIWKYTGESHHDLIVADDGRIYAITYDLNIDPRISATTKMFEDGITVLDPNGVELSHVSLLDAFWDSDYACSLRDSALYNNPHKIDPFHANRIVALDGRLDGVIPSFQDGNFLVSLRNLNALAVVDMRQEKIVWMMSGMWLRQHCPSVLDNGNILLFDNQGRFGSSRIIECDPFTQEIEWLYAGDADNDFYSEKFGAVQRLPNGNTLITESHFGRAFEVTVDGEIVWEFINPARAGDNDELIASLFEVTRLSPDFSTDWLR